MDVQPLRARTLLTETGGFLGGSGAGYTHSFNPAVGCAFARGFCGAFCYARGFAERLGGVGTWGGRLLVKRGAAGEPLAELLERELVRAARRDPRSPRHVTRLSIFSASTTDPCVGPLLEPYRACLRVVARYPVRRWVVQTRSPQVVELEEELLALGERVVLSFSLETDDEELWKQGPRGAPSIAARRRAFERMAGWPVRRHLAVSPMLPVREPEAFADWIAACASDATVDTFCAGDGSGGRRTASSALPELLAGLGLDWRDEEPARELHRLLALRMGERAGWSAQGFLRLA